MSAAFFALMRKDIRLFFGDRKALLITIAAPSAIASFYGYVFNPSSSGEASRIPVLVADRDASPISRAVIANLRAEKTLAVEPATLEAARERVRKGTATAALSIPTGFGAAAAQALFRGENKPEIGVFFDPSHAAEAGMVQGILMGCVMQAVSREAMSGAGGRENIDRSLHELESSQGMAPAEKRSLVDLLSSVRRWDEYNQTHPAPAGQSQAPGLSVPFTMRQQAVTAHVGVEYNSYAHSFAGMAVQFVLFLGIDVGIGLLYLRQRGLWRRLRAAPLSKTELLASRAASAALTSMFVLLVVFAFARVVFGVRAEGSLAGFLLVCAALSLMTAGFGLLIAAVGNSPEAARGLSILAILLMVMLGGAWVPTFIFPQWLQRLTLFVPTRWAVDGLDAVTWRGLGFTSALAPAAVLLGCSVLFTALAAWRFRWEAD